jgi:hypothetical protein
MAEDTTEVVLYDTVDVRFKMEVGRASGDALTKARTMGLMLAQHLADELEVHVLTHDGQVAQAEIPLTQDETVELQRAISEYVRETDPELSQILAEAADNGGTPS